MTSNESPRAPVRIAKIAGRYLIFDGDAASILRRHESTNGTLVGTLPQQPTQNVFLGLPIELRPEEAETLVSKGAAYVVDDVAAHMAALRDSGSEARKAYVESLKTSKQIAQKVIAERHAQKVAEFADVADRAKKNRSKQVSDNAALETDALFVPKSEASSSQPEAPSLGVTPTCSSELIPSSTDSLYTLTTHQAVPLCRHLQRHGYHMTPGLRFGATYSVYPGDPLRFHAHFMANSYDWNEEIPILDLVGGGRLATAVKKAFLIGGEEPAKDGEGEGTVRTFSIEWASM